MVRNDKTLEDEMSSQKLFKDKGNMPVSRPALNDSNTRSVEAKNTASQQNDKLRYISKYLVQFVPDAKPRNKETTVRISGARVLTSDKCVAILKEREEKIKKQQEEKERRRLQREQKKKEKEEQKKKKALVAEKKALAAEKKAFSAAKKAEKEANKATKGGENQEGNKSNRKRQNNDVHTTRTKLPRLTEDDTASSSTITTAEAENVCCICFQDYQGDEEDSDWVQYACKRWLHEDCINDIVAI